MSTELIFDELYANLDPVEIGTVYDYEIMPAGKFNGLDHNGIWVRVIKLSNDEFAYSRQDDSQDTPLTIGSMDEAAEYITEQISANEDANK